MPERYTLEHWEKCLPAMKRLHPDTLAIARSVYVDGVKPVEVARQTGRSAQNVNSALKRVEPYLQKGAAGLVFVGVWLPPELAEQVKQMAAQYEQNDGSRGGFPPWMIHLPNPFSSLCWPAALFYWLESL
ncbi:TPA: hypothetical protein L4R96_005207 [Pseudomonas aeruginosa]|nr:hypothetical protein [Pseudomonas aeruginosa]